MLFKSSILAQASGSVGGSTYAHNSAGMYIRNRSIPTDPNSTAQQLVRAGLTNNAQTWRDTLTASQRAGWESYAAGTPVIGKLGDNLYLSGQQWFMKVFGVRALVGVVDFDAPPTSGMASMSLPTLSITAAGSNLSVAFDNGYSWATASGGYLVVQCSRSVAPSINFFKSPFRYAGKVAGAATPPTSPASIANPFSETYVAGQKVFARICSVDSDNRPSSPVIVSAIVA